MSEKILQKIGRIREGITFLDTLRPDCRKRISGDPLYRGALLYYLYLMADGVVALAEMAIRERNLRPPQTYREAIRQLGTAGILDPKFAEEFSSIAGFRNFLAHDYEEIDIDLICNLLDRLPQVEVYLQRLSEEFKL